MRVLPHQILNVKIFLVSTPEGNVLIDTGIPGTEKQIKAAMQTWAIDPGAINCILLTHGHLDHIGCLSYLMEYSGAKVICHKSYAKELAAGKYEKAVPRSFFWKILNDPISRLLSKHLKGIQPDILVGDSLDLKELGFQGTILHTPGHSPGSISILFNTGDAFVGDLIRTNKKGEIDTGLFYAEKKRILSSLARIAKHHPERIHLSHGRIITGEELAMFLENQRDWIP